MTKQVYPNDLPYPFSDAVRTGNLLFVSGQVGIRDRNVVEGIEAQTRVTLDNMHAVLAQAGATLADVVKVTVFITDMSLWPKMNEIYVQYFPKDQPARSTLGVNALARPEMLVEIECVAEVGPGGVSRDA